MEGRVSRQECERGLAEMEGQWLEAEVMEKVWRDDWVRFGEGELRGRNWPRQVWRFGAGGPFLFWGKRFMLCAEAEIRPAAIAKPGCRPFGF